MKPAEDKILNLLHVDDDEADRFLLARTVSKLPITLTSASSGVEALKILSETQRLPEMILLDIRMPRMSGFEVLEQLKGMERLASIPIIMFSNSAHPPDIQRARELGAFGYCVKPADFADYLKFGADLYRGWLNSHTPCLWP